MAPPFGSSASPDAVPAHARSARGLQGGAALSLLVVAALLLVPASSAAAATAPVGLGTAGAFSVLAGSTVTNTGATVISGDTAVGGDLGVSPGSAITGFPPGVVNAPGTIHVADAVAAQAQADTTIGYNDAAGRAPDVSFSGVHDLVGETLVAGVYNESSGLSLNGTVTLDGQGNPDSVWIFQAGSTLITGTGSTVALINGAQACNVFWQVGSSATLGTSTTFNGTILALTSITVNATVNVQGRLLARNGAVTLDSDTIHTPACAPSSGVSAAPLLGSTSGTVTAAAFLIGAAAILLRRRRRPAFNR